MKDAHAAADATTSTSASPFVCTLQALSPAERARHAEVTQQVLDAVQQVRALPSGFGLCFAPQAGRLALLAAFVERERLCCPFLSFSITVAPESGPVWLNITGAEGVRAFLSTVFDLSDEDGEE